jgi:uncharacterized RDD family membrane protein YckC
MLEMFLRRAEPFTTTRFISAFIDHVIMTPLCMIFFLPGVIHWLITGTSVGSTICNYIGLIGVAIYFCKDCYYGQSVGKRLTKLQVINCKTDEIAKPFRCLVRDLFIVLFPIEAIFMLINPARRLGDIVAGTKMVVFRSEIKAAALNYFQLAVAFFLSYSFIILFSLLTKRL